MNSPEFSPIDNLCGALRDAASVAIWRDFEAGRLMVRSEQEVTRVLAQMAISGRDRWLCVRWAEAAINAAKISAAMAVEEGSLLWCLAVSTKAHRIWAAHNEVLGRMSEALGLSCEANQ